MTLMSFSVYAIWDRTLRLQLSLPPQIHLLWSWSVVGQVLSPILGKVFGGLIHPLSPFLLISLSIAIPML